MLAWIFDFGTILLVCYIIGKAKNVLKHHVFVEIIDKFAYVVSIITAFVIKFIIYFTIGRFIDNMLTNIINDAPVDAMIYYTSNTLNVLLRMHVLSLWVSVLNRYKNHLKQRVREPTQFIIVMEMADEIRLDLQKIQMIGIGNMPATLIADEIQFIRDARKWRSRDNNSLFSKMWPIVDIYDCICYALRKDEIGQRN